MNRMNQTDDVVREYFQQHFVDLCSVRLAADEVSEFPFHRREGRFYVAALVVVFQKFVTAKVVEVEEAIPSGSFLFWFHRGIRAEGDERSRAHFFDHRDHLAAAVRLVSGNLCHREILACSLNQWPELRNIVAVAVGHGNGCHDVGFYPDHRMDFQIVADILFVSVLGREMPIETLNTESSRINREIGFDRAERQAARRYEALNDRRDLLRLDHVKDAVVAGRAGDQALRLRFPQIGHEAAGADGGVNLESGSEQGVANREPRTPAPLPTFGNRSAQVAEQAAERLFLSGLRGVVGWPVLRVRDTDGGGNGRAAIFIDLPLHRELDCEGVLALHLAQFMIRAGAMIAVLAERYRIASIERLRGYNPSIAFLFDLRHRRYFESSLFPCVHCCLLICITIVGILAARCQAVDLTIHWAYSVGMTRRKPKAARKDEEIRLRLTLAQKESFRKAAEKAGLDVSNWLRSIAIREAALALGKD